MKILALNCGSSTVKYQLYELSPAERVLHRGLVDRIGSGGQARDHREAVASALSALADFGRIDGVGHRVVHGGELYRDSVVIDAEVERRIEECAPLAPLHNPHNLTGYRAAREALPGCPHVAVFDTAFHQTLPPAAFLYGLPYEFYSKYRIRRYGFHGTSHRYVSLRFAELISAPPASLKLVTCHLGSGSSICAIGRGHSVDVSLGFTPLEGLLMGTRGGDLDPGVLLHLIDDHGLSTGDLRTLLNHRSGLLGLSGLTSDMRELVEQRRRGNERARLAIDVFCHRVRRYLGAFYAILNGADAIVFTGGIGENSPEIRADCCASLEALGIRLDAARNSFAVGAEADISDSDFPTRVWVIPTNEELLIAREAARLLPS